MLKKFYRRKPRLMKYKRVTVQIDFDERYDNVIARLSHYWAKPLRTELPKKELGLKKRDIKPHAITESRIMKHLIQGERKSVEGHWLPRLGG
jgi:hypothetical protein